MPAATKSAPAKSTMPAPAAARSSGLAPSIAEVAANSTAADDDVADTMAKRLVPKNPYTARPTSSDSTPA